MPKVSGARMFLSLLAAFCFSLPVSSVLCEGDSSSKESQDAGLFEQLKVYTDVLAIVQRDYVKEASNRSLVEGSIKGLLSTLDPHSGYLDPDFYQDLQVQTRGEFGGLGIEITIKEGLLVIVSPMEGSPAEKAGLQAGDTIVKIEGKFTREYSLVDAVKKLRGPKGSVVTLSIFRKGRKDLFEVNLERDNIVVKSVRSRHLEDGFGLIRINQFVEKTSDDVRRALNSLAKAGPDGQIHGLVLDMRNNPGGLLAQAVRVSDFFLKNGVIVYTDGRVESQKQKFYAHERGTEPEYPMVVLVNGGSASAAEIVAGAMKDHGRAVIVGTQTFGKGSVQTITPLANGGAITLTTALYYTKSGRSIQSTGVTPDIDLPINEEAQASVPSRGKGNDSPLIRESDLQGAIENPEAPSGSNSMQQLNKTPTVDKDLVLLNVESAPLQDLLKNDMQLQRALDLLKTYNIFSVPKAETAPLQEGQAS